MGNCVTKRMGLGRPARPPGLRDRALDGACGCGYQQKKYGGESQSGEVRNERSRGHALGLLEGERRGSTGVDPDEGIVHRPICIGRGAASARLAAGPHPPDENGSVNPPRRAAPDPGCVSDLRRPRGNHPRGRALFWAGQVLHRRQQRRRRHRVSPKTRWLQHRVPSFLDPYRPSPRG